MTLMSFHVFLSERVSFSFAPFLPTSPLFSSFCTHLLSPNRSHWQVDATILEVGVGGTYDSTNIVPYPIVTGVTSLGLDHIFVLGNTIEEIANQKGGIYKVSLFSTSLIFSSLFFYQSWCLLFICLFVDGVERSTCFSCITT